MMRALPTVDQRARRRRDDVHQRLRQLPALLSRRARRCSPASTRTTTAPRATTRSAAGATRAARAGPHPGELAAGRRLSDRFRRQVAQRAAHPAPRAAGWNEWDGLVGEGGEGLSSFYDYDVFEPDGGPRHFGDRPADYQTDALTREYALPFIDAQAARPRVRSSSGSPTTRPHNGVGRDDPAGPSLLGGSARDPQGQAERDPAAALRARLLDRPRPAPAVVRRARRQRQAEVRSPPSAACARGPRPQIDARLPVRARGAAALDDAVARIVDHLEATAQLSNTVLVFLTDQGVMAGEHRIKRGKNRPYEEAIKVPLLMRGPRIAADADGRRARGQHRPRADDARPRRRARSRPSSRARSTARRWSPVLGGARPETRVAWC